MIVLEVTKRTDSRLLARMSVHYSQPKGFVGRNICYAVLFAGVYYGHIVGGSATRFLPGREDTIGKYPLNNIVNNLFFSVFPVNGKYPVRNFTTKVVLEFEKQIKRDWKSKYGDDVLAFETLVELPRTGELYKKAGYTECGVTKGYTCKRVGGAGTDSWSGRRVWNTAANQLRPKRVFVKSA